MPDEKDRILSAISGDEDALSALLEQYGPQVRAGLDLAPKWRTVVSMDDIMQVTYLEAFLRVRDFVPGGSGSFGRWLRRIAENNLRDAVKELGRQKRPPPQRRLERPGSTSYVALIEQLSDAGGTPSRAASEREAEVLVEAALRRLSDDYQRVIRMFELEGRSGPEIAKSMGRSHGAVKMLLARSREQLREMLGSGSRFFSDFS